MKIFKVAIIGSGRMAEEHLKVLSRIQNFNVTGIFNRTISKAKKLKKKYNIDYAATSISDLFYKTKADLLIIAINEIALRKILIQVTKFDWTIFTEKPLGYNYKDFKKINDLLNKRKKSVFVGYNRRYYDTVLKATSLLKNNKNKRDVFIFDQENPFILKKSKKQINNWMYLNSTHLLSLTDIFCRGKVVGIKYLSKFNFEKVHCIIKFSSGDTLNFFSIWKKPGPWSVKIYTKDLFLDLQPLEKLFVRNKNNKNFEIKNNFNKNYKYGLVNQANEILKMLKCKKNHLVDQSYCLKLMKFTEKIFKTE